MEIIDNVLLKTKYNVILSLKLRKYLSVGNKEEIES